MKPAASHVELLRVQLATERAELANLPSEQANGREGVERLKLIARLEAELADVLRGEGAN